MKYSMITILGPTASGKTSLAAALAARINSLGAHLSGTPAKGAEIIRHRTSGHRWNDDSGV